MKTCKVILWRILRNRKITIALSLFLVGFIFYFLFFQNAILGPIAEHNALIKLETTKQNYKTTEFVTDGCSGNVSNSWNTAVTGLSKLWPDFAERYSDDINIPFERACMIHDQAYHQGIGGYSARLLADNVLREAIISYGINNTEEIKRRTGLKTKEEAMFLYEVVAETVYQGVRIGGAACTGKPYAWGYGYNKGTCYK